MTRLKKKLSTKTEDLIAMIATVLMADILCFLFAKYCILPVSAEYLTLYKLIMLGSAGVITIASVLYCIYSSIKRYRKEKSCGHKD